MFLRKAKYIVKINAQFFLVSFMFYFCTLGLYAQKKDYQYLLFAHDDTKLKDLNILQNDYKLFTQVQSEPGAQVYYIANNENLVIDTLKTGFFDFVHPVGEKKIWLRGPGFYRFLQLDDSSTHEIIDSRIPMGWAWGSTPILFEENIVNFRNIKKGAKRKVKPGHLNYEIIKFPLYKTTDKPNKNDITVLRTDFLIAEKKSEIPGYSFITDTYGLSEEELHVYLRYAKSLITIDTAWNLTEYTLPDLGKNEAWLYYYDWLDKIHYFVALTKDLDYSLYWYSMEKGLNKVGKIPKFEPKSFWSIIQMKITGSQALVCEGNIRDGYDYYLYPIYPEVEKRSAIMPEVEVRPKK